MVALVLAWNLLTLQSVKQDYARARDSVEVLIHTGTTVWLAPPIDTVRRKTRAP